MPREERCAPGFGRLVEAFPAAALESHPGTVYGLWPDLRLAYFNPAWLEFAQANGAAPALLSADCLGASVMEATAEALRPFFAEFYRSALSAGGREPPSYRYECSSADRYREFVMALYPLGRNEGLLVVNSLVDEASHDPARRPSCPPLPHAYADANGIIHQCAHCRRIQNLGVPGRWDWVPAWVRRPPPETSHSLCSICLNHYYPDTDR